MKSSTWNNEYWMHFRSFTLQMKFSTESDIHSLFTRATPVLKFSVDTSSIFFNRPEVVTRKPRFRSPVFIKRFFLYCGADSPSAGLAVHFVCILYVDETKIAIALIQSVTSEYWPQTLIPNS